MLLLADARLPSGAHVHSGGIEQAVDDGVVSDLGSLSDYLVGRLLTAGVLAAHAAALSWGLSTGPRPLWCALDAEASARMLAPSVCATSRRQGRSLLRTGHAVFGRSALRLCAHSERDGPHLAVAQGAVAAAAGLEALDAALVAAYGTVAGPASSAIRLLGLDPVAVAAAQARLAGEIDAVARDAAPSAFANPEDLPCPGSPGTDRLSERHAAREERLFAS
ncbi:MAG TPA: urease accessory UreF family protein [Acidimicrobiales bacterium]|nr:urease accessory UreF family protein [Acidimicrobiales bacterium]